jgi:hypothetical protein
MRAGREGSRDQDSRFEYVVGSRLAPSAYFGRDRLFCPFESVLPCRAGVGQGRGRMGASESRSRDEPDRWGACLHWTIRRTGRVCKDTEGEESRRREDRKNEGGDTSSDCRNKRSAAAGGPDYSACPALIILVQVSRRGTMLLKTGFPGRESFRSAT